MDGGKDHYIKCNLSQAQTQVLHDLTQMHKLKSSSHEADSGLMVTRLKERRRNGERLSHAYAE